eukprot:scaffold563234_cov45-Prasinocladus_malaysianus.AAC.1
MATEYPKRYEYGISPSPYRAISLGLLFLSANFTSKARSNSTSISDDYGYSVAYGLVSRTSIGTYLARVRPYEYQEGHASLVRIRMRQRARAGSRVIAAGHASLVRVPVRQRVRAGSWVTAA